MTAKANVTAAGSVSLVRSDDSGDGALGGRSLGLGIFRVQDIQIFQAGAGVEEDDCVVWGEESAGQEFLVGDEAGGAFGGGEDAFDHGPVASGGEDFWVGGGEGEASALFQDVEDEVVGVGFWDA